jgi:hypothetical protein
MRRSLLLLLALSLTLLGVDGLIRASATECGPCACLQTCGNEKTACLAPCNGSTSCEDACARAYDDCITRCH